MNFKIIFLILAIAFSSCINDQDNEQITWLTNDSSKLWVLYSHNYVSGDNGKFVDREPYAFLNIFGATHLKLDKDFKFSLGNEDGMHKYGNWQVFSTPKNSIYLSLVGSNRDTLAEPDNEFKIVKLSPKELIIRVDAPQGSALPYYEFRYKSN